VTLFPEQLVAPQLVPAGTSAHAPVLVQAAICPQTLVVSFVQRLFGLVPALAGPHEPSAIPDCLLAAAQAWQMPEHAMSQQTPSAQSPLAHSMAAEHG
jgi:hypothetical protein